MTNWEPKLGETYYFVTHWLRVSKSSWASWSGEKRLLEAGNCFRTEEEAEAKLEKIKAIFKDQQIIENRPKLTVEVFDREDCPDWAKWAAVDADGEAFYYESEPDLGYKTWLSGLDVTVRHIQGSYARKDWKHSLIKRPRKCKQLPDWVYAGSLYYDTSNHAFRNFTDTELEDIDGLKQLIEFGIYRNARCEVLETDEIEALIGKVLQHTNGDKALVCSYNKKTNLVYMGHYTVTPEELLCYWTLDGERCGKMFYWSRRSGTWIEP